MTRSRVARWTAVAGPVLAATVAVAPAAAPADASSAGASPTGADPAAVLARLTEAQRVGQLVMIGASPTTVWSATRAAITDDHVGSVILTGRTTAGVTAVRSTTDRLQRLATAAATGAVPLLVATDQEGGAVQVLSGPGFDRIPSALAQGGWSRARLRHSAVRWAGQLAAAGVGLNLAPVLDTVPPDQTSTNQPIGRWDREFGTDPATVTAAGTAFVRGMHASGVETAVKHFPGLGRADGNTDTTAGVSDPVTTRHDAYVRPFASVTDRGGAGFVMVSLATYPRIDPAHRAVFSPTVLRGMLRHDLGFTGVVMTDSIDAVALRDLSPGRRAVRFVAAGGDLVLATRPSDADAVVTALLRRARADGTFRHLVDAACLRVLVAKQRAGLLPGAVAAATAGSRLTVAERTSARRLDLHTRVAGAWTPAVALDAGTLRAPALTRLPATAEGLEIAEVTPSGSVSVRACDPSGGGTWLDVGGAATSAPGLAADRAGRLAVAVRGPGLGVRLRERGPDGRWSAWSGLGGAFTAAAPALLYTPSGDLVVLATSQTQAVRLDVRHAGRWSGWTTMPGAVARSGPAAAADPATGAISVLVAGRDSALWQATVGRRGWTRVPDMRPAAAPAVVATPVAVTAVVAGLDGRLHLARRTPDGWGRWSILPFD